MADCGGEARSQLGGLAFYAGNTLFVTATSAVGKELERGGMTAFQLSLLRSLFQIGVTMATEYRRAGWAGVRSIGGKNRRLLAVRGVLGTAAFLLMMLAVDALPMGDAVSLMFVMPLIASLLASALLGEPFTPWTWVAVATCLSGVCLVSRPTFVFGRASAHPLPPAGVLFALTQAAASAGAKITIRAIARTESSASIMFYQGAVGAALSGAVCLLAPGALGAMGWVEAGMVAAMVGASYLGQSLLIAALARAPAGPATAMGYLQVLWGTLAGGLFWGEVVTPSSAAGAACIMAGCAVQAAGAARPQQPQQMRRTSMIGFVMPSEEDGKCEGGEAGSERAGGGGGGEVVAGGSSMGVLAPVLARGPSLHDEQEDPGR